MALPSGREAGALLSVASGVAALAGLAWAAWRSGKAEEWMKGTGGARVRRGGAGVGASPSHPPPPSGAGVLVTVAPTAAGGKVPTPGQLASYLRLLLSSLDAAPALIRAADREEAKRERQFAAMQKQAPPPQPLAKKFETVVSNLSQQAVRNTGFTEAQFAAVFEQVWLVDKEVTDLARQIMAKHPLHGMTADIALHAVQATLESEYRHFMQALGEVRGMGKPAPPVAAGAFVSKGIAETLTTNPTRAALLQAVSLRMYELEGASEDGAKAVLLSMGGPWTPDRVDLWPHIVRHYLANDAAFGVGMQSAASLFKWRMWAAGIPELGDDHHRGPTGQGGLTAFEDDDGEEEEEEEYGGMGGPGGLGGMMGGLPPELLAQLPPGMDMNQLMAMLASSQNGMGGGR